VSAYGIFLSEGVVITQFLCEIFVLYAHTDQFSCHRLARSLQLRNITLHIVSRTNTLHRHATDGNYSWQRCDSTLSVVIYLIA